LKNLFQKYSHLGDNKKEYLAIDFLKIIQEYILLGFFSSPEEILQVVDYISQRFLQEIEVEK
jgi:hypothetical protein